MPGNLHHHLRSGNIPAAEQSDVTAARSSVLDRVAHERALLPVIVRLE
jgi:hypothetical protein